MTYPVATDEMQYLMRNLAIVLADGGNKITVVAADNNPFLRHPNIVYYYIPSFKGATKSSTCKAKSKRSLNCVESEKLSKSILEFWNMGIVRMARENKGLFDAMVSPNSFNAFTYPIVYNSSTPLILVNSDEKKDYQSLHPVMHDGLISFFSSGVSSILEYFIESLEDDTSRMESDILSLLESNIYDKFIHDELQKIVPNYEDELM